MSKLKPCPFCGGDGALSVDPQKKVFYGSCWVCGARGSAISYKDQATNETIEKAVEAWNERAGECG